MSAPFVQPYLFFGGKCAAALDHYTEHVGGFWILAVADEDEARTWGRKAAVVWREPMEVRPFH
jgi:uncharacterized glyoxalase superfamily protein PhnB